jgi:hypothetical protein
MNQFHWWQGRSGLWHVHSIIGIADAFGWSGAANYILVRRNRFGLCAPLYVGQTSEIGRRMREHLASGLIDDALDLGLNEVHVHLLARSERVRFGVETDLRNGQLSPLNRQGVTSLLNG